MAESTISWCDYTFNPWIGCTKVSDGCKFCYAERENGRFRWVDKWGPQGMRKQTSEANWQKILRLNDKGFEKYGRRPRVFCASLADVFEDHPALPLWRKELFNLIYRTDNLNWLILTKRPENVMRMVMDAFEMSLNEAESWFVSRNHVWIGTSVENQKTANERIPKLLEIPAAVRFVSVEPMLGSMDLVKAVGEPDEWDWHEVNAIQDANDDIEPEELVEECELESDWINYGEDLVVNPEHTEWVNWRRWRAGTFKLGRTIQWVIVGGESGPYARAMHPAWVRKLRDDCETAKIPFHFKQWGEWEFDSESTAKRIGRKAAGRLLDGVVHDAFPGEFSG